MESSNKFSALLLIAGACAALLVAVPSPARACDLVVPDQQPTLQAAVDTLHATGGVICVKPGLYAGVTIGKQKGVAPGSIELVALNGVDGSFDVVIAPGNAVGVAVSDCAGCAVRGIRIGGGEGGATSTGLLVKNSSDFVAEGIFVATERSTGKDPEGVEFSGCSGCRLINSFLVGNPKDGVIVTGSGPVELLHNTCHANQRSCVVVNTTDPVTFDNNLVTANGFGSPGGFGLEVSVRNPTLSASGNVFYGNVQDAEGPIPGTGNLTTDGGFGAEGCVFPDGAAGCLSSEPLTRIYRDPAALDLRLVSGSPAEDQGIASDVDSDFEGDPRPSGGGPDSGADETAFIDRDLDGVPDGPLNLIDNCPPPPGVNLTSATFNPAQEDRDGDGIGDLCDNCPDDPNPGQEDANLPGGQPDGLGDACQVVTETCLPCESPVPGEVCYATATFNVLEPTEAIRVDRFTTQVFCTDENGEQLDRRYLVRPPEIFPNDVVGYDTGDQITTLSNIVDSFAPGELTAGMVVTCQFCYGNEARDPDLDGQGNCAEPDGVCNDVLVGQVCCAPFSFTVSADAPLPDDGCSPGYWKNHPERWPETVRTPPDPSLPVSYQVGDDFDATFSVFGNTIDRFDPDITLLDALDPSFGVNDDLARHATAALLSASHPGVSYPLTPAQVIQLLASGDPARVKDLFATFNNQGCPLN